jgi:hypothetical protein
MIQDSAETEIQEDSESQGPGVDCGVMAATPLWN